MQKCRMVYEEMINTRHDTNIRSAKGKKTRHEYEAMVARRNLPQRPTSEEMINTDYNTSQHTEKEQKSRQDYEAMVARWNLPQRSADQRAVTLPHALTRQLTTRSTRSYSYSVSVDSARAPTPFPTELHTGDSTQDEPKEWDLDWDNRIVIHHTRSDSSSSDSSSSTRTIIVRAISDLPSPPSLPSDPTTSITSISSMNSPLLPPNIMSPTKRRRSFSVPPTVHVQSVINIPINNIANNKRRKVLKPILRSASSCPSLGRSVTWEDQAE